MTGRPRINHAGKRFGRWTAVSGVSRSKSSWLCRCDCGAEGVVFTAQLVSGRSRSCGCLLKDMLAERSAKPDHVTKHPLYSTWAGINARCHCPDGKDFKNYGARGISVCDRWRAGENGMTGFECFRADMGPKPTAKHSIDRYPDNDGNYDPANCRWATAIEQASNKRSPKLSWAQVRQLRALSAGGTPRAEIASMFAISAGYAAELIAQRKRVEA